MIPGIKQQPPNGFHPDDVKVSVFFDEETKEFTHPLFAWQADVPKLRKKFFVYRPDAGDRHNVVTGHGFRIDHNAAAKTTRPNYQAFHLSLITALGTCRSQHSR